MPRTISLTAALVVVACVVSGCNSGGDRANSGFSTLTTISKGTAQSINQRYQGAVQPANMALSEAVAQAQQAATGTKANLATSVASAEAALTKAVRDLNGINAPSVLRPDLSNVVSDMTATVTDLMALAAASGSDVSGATAKVVADSGKVSAAENVTQLEVSQLSQ